MKSYFLKSKLIKKNTLLSCAYFAPGSSSYFYEHYVECIDFLVSENHIENFLFGGDFNLPGYEWSWNNALIFSGHHNNPNVRNAIRIIRDKFDSLGLKQCNFFKNNYSNILDLVFTNLKLLSICQSNDPLIPVNSLML